MDYNAGILKKKKNLNEWDDTDEILNWNLGLRHKRNLLVATHSIMICRQLN